MATQQRELKKSFIRIVAEMDDEPCAVDAPVKTDRLTRKYLLGLMTAVFNGEIAARK